MSFRRLVSYGEETTYGQAPADTSKWIGYATRFNGGISQAGDMISALDADRKKRPIIYGLDVAPSLEYAVQNAQFLKYAFGKVTTVQPDPTNLPNVYEHTLEISEGYELPSVTLVEHRLGSPQHGFQYLGCRVESLELSWDEDGLLTASMDFVAKQAEKITSLPSVTPDTTEPFKSSQKTVTINGVQNDYVVSGSVSLTNNHVKYPRSGDWISKAVADRVDIEASLDLFYVDSSILELMLNKTQFDVIVKFTRGTNDWLEIQLLGCYADVESELPAEGELMQTLNLKPSNLKIVARDTISAY